MDESFVGPSEVENSLKISIVVVITVFSTMCVLLAAAFVAWRFWLQARYSKGYVGGKGKPLRESDAEMSIRDIEPPPFQDGDDANTLRKHPFVSQNEDEAKANNAFVGDEVEGSQNRHAPSVELMEPGSCSDSCTQSSDAESSSEDIRHDSANMQLDGKSSDARHKLRNRLKYNQTLDTPRIVGVHRRKVVEPAPPSQQVRGYFDAKAKEKEKKMELDREKERARRLDKEVKRLRALAARKATFRNLSVHKEMERTKEKKIQRHKERAKRRLSDSHHHSRSSFSGTSAVIDTGSIEEVGYIMYDSSKDEEVDTRFATVRYVTFSLDYNCRFLHV